MKIKAADLWMYFYQKSYSKKRSGWYKFYPKTVSHATYYSGMHRRPGKKIVVELEASFPNQAQLAEIEYNNLACAAKETRREARRRFPHFGNKYSVLVEARSFLDKAKYDEFNAENLNQRQQAEISKDKKTLKELFSEISEYLLTGAIGRTILGVAAESDNSFNPFPFEALGYRAFQALNRLKNHRIEWSKESELFNMLRRADFLRQQDVDAWKNTVHRAKSERDEQWRRDVNQFRREWEQRYREYSREAYEDVVRRYTRIERVYFVGVQTLQQLKQKRNELAMLHHPDVGGNEAIMKEINIEYSLLESVLT